VIPVYRCLLVCVLPLPSAHETAGAAGIRRSPRPLWAEDLSTARAHVRSEVAERASGIKTTSLRAKREAIQSPSFRDGPQDQTRNLENSGFDASHRPGMTMEASLTRLESLTSNLAHRAGDDKIIVVAHQRARDAVSYNSNDIA